MASIFCCRAAVACSSLFYFEECFFFHDKRSKCLSHRGACAILPYNNTVQEAFAAHVMEKEALLEIETEKHAAAAREQKMLALELQQREAV